MHIILYVNAHMKLGICSMHEYRFVVIVPYTNNNLVFNNLV